MTGKLMPQVVWVYRCLDGCDGTAWSLQRKNVEVVKRDHKIGHGHRGEITQEDFGLVEDLE